MKIKTSIERIKEPGSPIDGHYVVRLDIEDDDGSTHWHCGRDKSPARAMTLAAYHWHQHEARKAGEPFQPYTPVDGLATDP